MAHAGTIVVFSGMIMLSSLFMRVNYLPVVPNDEWEEFEGVSYTCSAIVEYLRTNSIQCPLYNLERGTNW